MYSLKQLAINTLTKITKAQETQDFFNFISAINTPTQDKGSDLSPKLDILTASILDTLKYDITNSNKEGGTPINIASGNGNKEIEELLKQQRIELDDKFLIAQELLKLSVSNTPDQKNPAKRLSSTAFPENNKSSESTNKKPIKPNVKKITPPNIKIPKSQLINPCGNIVFPLTGVYINGVSGNCIKK